MNIQTGFYKLKNKTHIMPIKLLASKKIYIVYLLLCTVSILHPIATHAMQNNTQKALRLLRPIAMCTGAYYLFDFTQFNGKKTRKTIEAVSERLSLLYESGTEKIEQLIGKTHEDTISLLKKQHRESQKTLKKLIEENKIQKNKIAKLLDNQERIEKAMLQQKTKN